MYVDVMNKKKNKQYRTLKLKQKATPKMGIANPPPLKKITHKTFCLERQKTFNYNFNSEKHKEVFSGFLCRKMFCP